METPGNENKDSFLDRLKLLKNVHDLFSKEELELIRDKSKKSYHLFPYPKDRPDFRSASGHHSIQLSKYVIQGTGKYNDLNCELLEAGNELYNELEHKIKHVLGEDYVILFCRELDTYKHQQELFCVKFYELFNRGQFGIIKFNEARSSYKAGELSLKTRKREYGQVEMAIDLVYPNSMSYNGVDVAGKPVLFYGFDVESNKYLHHFFTHQAPKSILNIIPYVSNSFVHDNVD